MNLFTDTCLVSISVVQPCTAKLSSVACALHSRQNGVCTSLCTCRCILQALKVLHQAGFAHTDLRWQNIILQHADQWVLIDLEFACELDSVPFTPKGEPISSPCMWTLSRMLSDVYRQLQSKESKISLQSVVVKVPSQNICVLSVEMVLHMRTPNMLQVLDVQVCQVVAIQGVPSCADYRTHQKGAARVVHSTMVKKLWLYASWRSYRGMPGAGSGWPRDWAQAVYASWTMQHCCVCAWASMVFLKACGLLKCIAGLLGDLPVGFIVRRSDINNVFSAYKLRAQYAVCVPLCCMYAACTIKQLSFSFRCSKLIACESSCNTYVI